MSMFPCTAPNECSGNCERSVRFLFVFSRRDLRPPVKCAAPVQNTVPPLLSRCLCQADGVRSNRQQRHPGRMATAGPLGEHKMHLDLLIRHRVAGRCGAGRQSSRQASCRGRHFNLFCDVSTSTSEVKSRLPDNGPVEPWLSVRLFILAKGRSLVQAVLRLSFEEDKIGEPSASLPRNVYHLAVGVEIEGNEVDTHCTVPILSVAGAMLRLPGTVTHSYIDTTVMALSLS